MAYSDEQERNDYAHPFHFPKSLAGDGITSLRHARCLDDAFNIGPDPDPRSRPEILPFVAVSVTTTTFSLGPSATGCLSQNSIPIAPFSMV